MTTDLPRRGPRALRTTRRPVRPARRGAMLVLVAILLPAVLSLVALFLGVSQMQLARSEMRLAADAAARAAAEAVLRTGDPEAAFETAAAIAATHNVSKQPVVLRREDVVFGAAVSTPAGEWKFIPNQTPFNAARVDVVKRRSAESGAVKSLFPGFGPAYFESDLSATAAQIDHEVMIVVEAGGSMHAPGRWEGVLAAFEHLAEVAPKMPNNIRVGMVACHNEPVLRMDLCSGEDLAETMQKLLEELQQTKLRQARNLGGGLKLAADKLAKSKSVADQTILFLGNGHSNKGPSPVAAARSAAARGQVIYCLNFGHHPDKDGHMRAAAKATGGKSVNVTDTSELPEIVMNVLINPSIVLIQ